MTAPVACISCGTELRDRAKFCHECGTRAPDAVDNATYKQVTVLFADVVRSMDIAAALDAERLREIMTELVKRSTAAVQRYGAGSVEYTGDGSWHCSALQSRWKTTLFVRAWPPWPSKRKPTGWRPR